MHTNDLDIDELETHRRTLETAVGPISFLDVGDGPTTLLVHGVGTNALLWRHVIDAVRDERRCVAIDLPLHGHTPAPIDRSLDVAARRPPVEALSRRIWRRSTWWPTTPGARWPRCSPPPTRAAAHAVPDQLRRPRQPPARGVQAHRRAGRLGLLAAGAADLLADLAGTRELVFAMGYDDVEQLPLEVVARFLEPILDTPEHAHQFEQLLVSMRPEDLLGVEPELARLTVPTLIVWGTADEFFAPVLGVLAGRSHPRRHRRGRDRGGQAVLSRRTSRRAGGRLRPHWASVPAAGLSPSGSNRVGSYGLA